MGVSIGVNRIYMSMMVRVCLKTERERERRGGEERRLGEVWEEKKNSERGNGVDLMVRMVAIDWGLISMIRYFVYDHIWVKKLNYTPMK